MSANRPALFGLVLAGGKSTRMGRDKAALIYHDRPQLHVAFDLLDDHCEQSFVSVAADQTSDPLRESLPQIVDSTTLSAKGPSAGLLSAHHLVPDVAWMVMACDLPWSNSSALKNLIQHRRADMDATAYLSSHDQLPEPLFAIWEPSALKQLAKDVEQGRSCPRKCLINVNTCLIEQTDPKWLDNMNSQSDLEAAGLGS